MKRGVYGSRKIFVVFLVVFVFGVISVSCGASEEKKEVEVEAVQKQLKEYHGLEKGSYKIYREPPYFMDQEYRYSLVVDGMEYGLYEVAEARWSSDYYADAFAKKMECVVERDLTDLGIPRQEISEIKVTVRNYLPLYVNADEAERIYKGEADSAQWRMMMKTYGIEIIVDLTIPYYSVTEEQITWMKEAWFFATKLNYTKNSGREVYDLFTR